MSGIAKHFGATVALDAVDLRVDSGQVLALVGENGAGKSTLMKILSGAVRPDAGGIQLDGERFAPDGPLAARASGVAMIYQESNVAPDLSVEANLILGAERHRLGFIDRPSHRRRIHDVLARLGRADLPLAVPVSALSPGDRQLVEIARALLTDARVVVMDEPTSSLGLVEIEKLFDVIDGLRREGVAVIYISHFLEEVQRIADRYIVLRDGRVVGDGATPGVTVGALVELMIGRRLPDMFPVTSRALGAPLLALDGVATSDPETRIDLTVHRGEILGLAGLVGAGRTELLRGIYGLDPIVSGEVQVAGVAGGKQAASGLTPGVGLLSENRQAEGLALGCSVGLNMLLSRLGPFARWGWLDTRAMARTVDELVERLGIRARDTGQPVGELSGGNQQKVAFARLLHHDVDLLLLDEPTRGIDVASKAQIYEWIGELAGRGKGVVLVSDYVPELLGVCDRIAVMHRGRMVANRLAKDWTEHDIMAAATSGEGLAA
ncbi:MAG: sugar ABC transporter ATP-binding protein [Vicinamibacterales bacterium]|nr:sugar ABC transporter ATP-binding protein [Vicinamibacterales bacterium]MDP6608644.1 sugar ABC transporter ATP-binding protein [Vicinamibacterales bacterium]|tara:strand:+ start:3242 stop:4720 length:1479 start_codon:yes stop_codon:yes gene_type:complete